MDNANRQYIAGLIEKAGMDLLNIDTGAIKGSFLHADRIRIANFVEAMLYLLRVKNGIDSDYSDFANSCNKYLGVPMDTIPEDTVKQLYHNFCSLLSEEIATDNVE